MAEQLTRTNPLHAAPLHELPSSVRASSDPFVAMVNLRVDPSGPGARAAESLLGVDLPTTPNTWVAAGDKTVIWLGPDEWLVTSTDAAGWVLEYALRAAVASHNGAATDVSAQRITLHLTGEHVRDVLATGCSLDLHPTVFTAGSAAQTTLGQAGIILLALDEAGQSYDVLVRSSFAGYLTTWLLDAAGEFQEES